MSDVTRQPDKDPLEPYRQAIADSGSGFSATLWASPRTQILRFDVLIDMIGPEAFRDSVVLDLGCGDGALAAHLQERSVGHRRYIGVDGLLEQVRVGEERGLPDTTFVCSDLLANPRSLGAWGADIVIISGTLNTMDQDTSVEFVTTLFEEVAGTVAFNFLSDRAPAERLVAGVGPAVRHDVLRWIDISLQMTPLVAFRQDHLDGHDAAIVLRRRT